MQSIKMRKIFLILFLMLFLTFIEAKADTAINDLTSSDPTFNSISLTWTTPGTITTASYDIRYSESVVNEANWDSATKVYGEPLPQEAGMSQSMVITCLSPQTTYYFAIKSCNNEGNCSALSNVVSLATLGEPTNIVHISDCGSLSQSNTYYILDNDVRCDGTCFTITGSNIVLDLNGYTITYDDLTSGLPNADFELGNGEVPLNWDLTAAPSAKRSPTSEKVMNKKWYLKFDHPESDQVIISPWIDLPQNHNAIAYFIRGDKSWDRIVNILLEVEHETDGVIASFNDDEEYSLEFKTLDKAGKYRLKLTYFSLDTSSWQANHDYNKGDIVVPTVVNGHCYVVTTDNGLSADTEPEWNSFSTSTTNDGGLIWTAYKLATDINIDLLDLRPTGDYGIYRAYKNGNVVIRNGSIVQGKGGGFRSHAIYNLSSNQMNVDNMYIETWGLETENFFSNYSDNCSIHHSTIINNNPFDLNRHQIGAPVNFKNSSNCNVFNNNIVSDTGWGTIYIGFSSNCNAYNNILKTKTVITNHHAIALYDVENVHIFNNNIEGDPGQGILVSNINNYNRIFDNIITIKSIAPNFEYGCMSIDAIRLNDYLSKSINNIKIYNNQIYLIGDFDEYYSSICSDFHVNGILMRATGENNYIHNNYIKVTVIDDNVCGSGISSGSDENNEVIFENNTIESNCSNIMLTSYSRKSHYSTFISNTFIKNDNTTGLCSDFYKSYPPPKYCTLSSRYTSTSIKNTHFIDTVLENGASLDLFLSSGLGDYSYFVDWYLNLVIKDHSGNPVPNAIVYIENKNGDGVFSGATDPNGRINKILLNQFEHYGNGMSGTSNYNYQTPHVINISATGFQPFTKEVNMYSTKTEVITLMGEGEILLYSKLENGEEVNSPTIVTEKVSGWETGAAINESGTGDVTFEAGYSDLAVRLNGFSGNDEQIVFKGSNFDFYDLEGDGGRLDFWLKFNVDPHQAGEYYILRTQPWSDIFNIDLLGKQGNPYLIFEFFGNADNAKTGFNRFLVYTRDWDKWENWQKDEWHLITLTWKRNPLEADDELHLYIDGTQEGCPSCNDTGGILPTPNSEDWTWNYEPDDVQVVLGNYFDLGIDMSVDELWSFSSGLAPSSQDDTIPPTTPINLSAEAVSATQININWNPSLDNVEVAGYEIYRNNAKIDTTTNTSYADQGLSPGTSYTYKISAYDAADNESGQSSTVQETTLSDLFDSNKPSSPKNLRIDLLKQ